MCWDEAVDNRPSFDLIVEQLERHVDAIRPELYPLRV